MTDESSDVSELEQRLGFEAIPEAVKTHENWLCWKYKTREQADGTTKKTKTPLKAYDSTHPYAKANDPDTWTTYENALAWHARPGTDTAGIGFVFSEDDMIIGIDLDNVRDPDTGDIEPAAREIITTLASYTELSPSGTGFHLLVLGSMPAAEYNKQPFERADADAGGLGDVFDGDPDIEVYEKKRFFTMSGDHADMTPETIEHRTDELQDIADDYLQRSADDAALGDFDGTGANIDLDSYDPEDDPDVGAVVTLDDDKLVEKAKQAKNGDKFRDLYDGRWESYYPSQSEADMGFCGMLAFWTQRDMRQMDSIFRDSGLMRSKWDEDRGAQTYGEMTLEEAARGAPDVYDPLRRNDYDSGSDDAPEASDDDRPDGESHAVADPDGDDDADPIADGDGGGPPTDPDDDGDDEPDPVSEFPGEVVTPPAGSPLTRRPESSGNRGYSVRRGDPDDPTFEPITNFLLSVEHILQLPDGSESVELHVIPADGRSYSVQVDPSVFNEPHEFRAAVCTGISPWFDGSRTDLSRLRELLGTVGAPVLTGVKHIGTYGMDGANGPPELVLPGGTLRKNGWVDTPTHVYIERGVEAERKVTLSPETKPDAGFNVDTVAEVLDLLPQTRDPERFIPVLGWFYAAAFRPFIKAREGEFNHLTVTGDTGSGKSTSLTTVAECFGMGGDPFGLRGTKFELTANISVPNALPLLYDEYKPSELESYILEHFHDHIRKSSRGAVEQRGRADGSTESYPLNAPLVVAGESAIQGPAERRRSIMTTFRETTTNAGSETSMAFDALRSVGGASDHAYAWYWWALDQLEDIETLDARWEAAQKRVTDILRSAGYDPDALDPLPFRGLQTVVFGVRLYRSFADEMGVASDAAGRTLMSEAAVEQSVSWLSVELLDGEQRKSHMEEFLELMSEAASMEYLEEDTHFTFVYGGTPNEELRFHLGRCYSGVRKYVRDYDIGDDVDILASNDYSKRFADAAENTAPEAYVTCHSQNTPPINRAVGVRVIAADDAITGFEPSAFGSTAVRAPVNEDADTNNGDGPGVTVTSSTDGEMVDPEADGDDNGNGGAEPDAADDAGGIAYDAVPRDAEGPAADRRRVYVALAELYDRDTEPVGFGALCARCAEKHDFSPGKTEELVDDLLERGEAMDAGGDKLRPA